LQEAIQKKKQTYLNGLAVQDRKTILNIKRNRAIVRRITTVTKRENWEGSVRTLEH
jgi:hypothetical protein